MGGAFFMQIIKRGLHIMITNLGLGIAEILACFFGIIVLEKLFGKRGLFIWMAAAVIFANIQVSKQVDLPGGISCTLGNVVFASTYLTTDILNEKYGPKASRNAVRIAAALERFRLLAPCRIGMRRQRSAYFSRSHSGSPFVSLPNINVTCGDERSAS